MDDNTDQFEKPKPDVTTTKTVTESTAVGPPKPSESHILNVSVRAWLAVLVIYTLCYCTAQQIPLKEPFYTVCVAVVTFYFATTPKPKTQAQ